jgi:quinol monooxygenase YgiN
MEDPDEMHEGTLAQDYAITRQESTNGQFPGRLILDPVAARLKAADRLTLGGSTMSTQIPVSHMAFVRARAGRSMELGARLSSLIEPTRQAPGCLHFALQHSLCDPELWLVSGFWSNQQAMNAYFSTSTMDIFAELVQELVVDSLDFHTFSDVSKTQATGAYTQLNMHQQAG